MPTGEGEVQGLWGQYFRASRSNISSRVRPSTLERWLLGLWAIAQIAQLLSDHLQVPAPYPLVETSTQSPVWPELRFEIAELNSGRRIKGIRNQAPNHPQRPAMDERTDSKAYGGCEGPEAMYVKLISSDGHEFIVKREHALTSGTIKAMLSGPGQFAENEANEVNFREIP